MTIPTISDIEARRKRLRLSVCDLASRAGVHFASIYRWRKGETEPLYSGVIRLAEALDRYEAETKGAAQ